MTLEKELGSRLTTIHKGVLNKILVLDVERLDGITEQHYWDRGDLKNRYIHYETVKRHPRTTVFCAKWYDEAEVIRLAEWDRGGRKAFLRRIHRLFEQCDIAVGHNIDSFDLPILRADTELEAQLGPLPSIKTVDTLKVLRRRYGQGIPFKAMDAFCKMMGLEGKTDHYDRHAMERVP